MKRNVDDLLACQQESQKERKKKKKMVCWAKKKTIKTSEVIFYVRYNNKDSEDCNQVVVECGAFLDSK